MDQLNLSVTVVISQGHVVMGTQAVSVYQQVLDKTKGLSLRSQELYNGIEKRLGLKEKDTVSFIIQHIPNKPFSAKVSIILLIQKSMQFLLC